jgi:hypothetical protein
MLKNVRTLFPTLTYMKMEKTPTKRYFCTNFEKHEQFRL